MSDNKERIKQVEERLEQLANQQTAHAREINALRIEILRLKSEESESVSTEPPIAEVITPQQQQPAEPAKQGVDELKLKPSETAHATADKKSDLEKFIGENLINKIGIAITVIGVGIGAKYAIDHQMVSPLTRIILGYLVGLGLLAFAFRLKPKYENFSAVLLSGAMAILYLISFAAYSFYDLIPQTLAFVLMVAFTAFTVLASVNYNRQVIAHVGLVGAYAVPFLLSDGSGQVVVLFSYVSIINIGILVLAFKKYWKPLYWSSFVFTWLIYTSWYLFQYSQSRHFLLALLFATVFFLTFYITFIAYKLIKNEKFVTSDVILILSNSFVYFSCGYGLLDGHEIGGRLLGVFTLCNAIVHFMVTIVIQRKRSADRDLFYFVAGLVLVFITIAIPVQLDGSWVTLLWVAEAALLFWIGRTRSVGTYEKLSYPLMFLSFMSLIHDWDTSYGWGDYVMNSIFNIQFLTSLLFAGAFAFISYMMHNKNYSSALPKKWALQNIMAHVIPGLFIFVTYCAFRLEIAYYFDLQYHASAINTEADDAYGTMIFNPDILKFKTVWILNYSLLFVSALTWINIWRLRNKLLGTISLALNTLAIIVFLGQGLYEISELRDNFLHGGPSDYFSVGFYHIGIRYLSMVFLAIAIISTYRLTREKFIAENFRTYFDYLLHGSFLWLCSSELIHWLDIAGYEYSYKLGLSILWGCYSLLLIVLGIWKSKKYLRVSAIALFGVTLVKLFFYDIADLDTIAKTIVFVSLGVLLLIISFLYNKYKDVIFDEAKG